MSLLKGKKGLIMDLVKGYLGSDVRMDGSIETNNSLRIDATFIGKISSSHSVVVGTALNRIELITRSFLDDK